MRGIEHPPISGLLNPGGIGEIEVTGAGDLPERERESDGVPSPPHPEFFGTPWELRVPLGMGVIGRVLVRVGDRLRV